MPFARAKKVILSATDEAKRLRSTTSRNRALTISLGREKCARFSAISKLTLKELTKEIYGKNRNSTFKRWFWEKHAKSLHKERLH